MQICVYIGSVLLRAFTNISLKKEKDKKYLVLRFLFLKRLENLLMCKKWWYLLFLSLTAHEDIDSGLLSDFQDGKSV